MTKWIIGIDPSSKSLAIVSKAVGASNTSIDKYSFGRGAYTPTNAAQAHDAMMTWLDKHGRIMQTTECVAYLEAPLVGRGGVRSTLVQAYVSGVAQACLELAGIRTKLVQTKEWKKTVVGNGGASKDDVRSCVERRWRSVAGHCGSDQDLFDAAAICIYGQIIHKRSLRFGA